MGPQKNEDFKVRIQARPGVGMESTCGTFQVKQKAGGVNGRKAQEDRNTRLHI